MADIWTKQKRSEVMSRIKGKNTLPEVKLRSRLHKEGFRFRICQSSLPGKPDIVLRKYSSVIFVHGCFWHQHSCSNGRMPKTRTEFWLDKLTKNKLRDAKNTASLENLGWRVITVWECELEKNFDATVRKLISKLSHSK